MLSLLALPVLLGGCVSTPEPDSTAGGPTATCHVCRFNNDLACVCVKVKDNTPRAEHNGQTYYFCSDDCRKKFGQNPTKYLPAKTR